MKLNEYLARFNELKILYQNVKDNFLSRGLVHHNWNHILRDLAKGIIIGEKEHANMKIVLACILLHDIGRLYPELGKNYHSVGTEIAPKYLIKAGFTEDEIERIIHCMRAYGPSGIEEPKTLEARVCYDVDVLSCTVGYIGVARTFDYFMREEGMNVKQIMQVPSRKRKLREIFYTETGKQLGEKGYKKAIRFWQKLHQEFAEEERTTKEIIPDYEGD